MLSAPAAPLQILQYQPNHPHFAMFRPTDWRVAHDTFPNPPTHGNSVFRSRATLVPYVEVPAPTGRGDLGARVPPGPASLVHHNHAGPSKSTRTSKIPTAREDKRKPVLRPNPSPPPPLPEQVPSYLLTTLTVAPFRQRQEIVDVPTTMRRSRSRSQPKKTPRLADVKEEITPHRYDDDYFKPTGTECMSGKLDESSSIFRLPSPLDWKSPKPDRLRLVQLGGDKLPGKQSKYSRSPLAIVSKIPKLQIAVDAGCFTRPQGVPKARRKRRIDALVEGEILEGRNTKSSRTGTPAPSSAGNIPAIEITVAETPRIPPADPPPDTGLLSPSYRYPIRRKVLERAAQSYAVARTGHTIGIDAWEAMLDFEAVGQELGEKIV